ncbi:MAG TPA: OB-fold domain-containing protein [Pseudomonadales bacterium]|jgi:uncharacterized OB-fold protein|nr:OB-fold domain-containing protein [Pseudomonadales bacterium]HNV55645.1 OB-fold domain-containing protein [Pseudomonadales bacterium]
MSANAYYLPVGLPAPAPANDGLDKPYWEGTRAHKLMVQRCNQCKQYQWGPEQICNHCHSFDLGWAEVAGTGRIYSYERIWHPVHPALKERGPYLVVLIELPQAGNVRMVGNLLGDGRQEVIIGSAVEAVYEDHNEDPKNPFTLVQWKLV